MTRTVWQIYRLAAAEDVGLYHIHDPELIGVALLLRIRGAKVVYDVHEDYPTAIRQKRYIPRILRGVLASVIQIVEVLASRAFAIVLAERYYSERFPSGTQVLNHPLPETLPAGPTSPQPEPGVVRLLYTGSVSEDRGALIHASLPRLGAEVHVHVLGRCSPDLAERMHARAAPNVDRLHLYGVGLHVPYEVILEAYRAGGWTAGLALFPPSRHYDRKELTKFFEYMAAGIPVICSHFPVWSELIDDAGCGICVDQDDMEAIQRAVRYLADHPDEAREMGRRGREAVAKRYSWAQQAQSLLRLYEQLLADDS